MKTLKRNIATLALVICLVIFGSAAIFMTQASQPVFASAHGSSFIDLSGYNTSDALELIESIEEELQEQGTSILGELYKQRDFYICELTNATSDRQTTIQMILDTICETIACFEGTAFILPKDSNFGKDPYGASTYSFGLSPNCTCNWVNILFNSPCGHCLVWNDTSMAVGAIAAGFSLRGWNLAFELIMFNRSNKIIDYYYTPSNGGLIATSPQILGVAASNEIVALSEQASPGRLNGLFVNTIEGDTYNSLGSFWYSKTGTSNGNVKISVLDRYDWERGPSGTGGVFNNTMVLAQEIGVVTPFYTKIDVTVAGYAPFNWEYTNNGVAITGAPSGTTTLNIPTEIYDLRLSPWKYPNSKVSITSIAANAFSGHTSLSQISIPATVTSLGANAFQNCVNLTIHTAFANKPIDWHSSWNPNNRPVVWGSVSICGITSAHNYTHSYTNPTTTGHRANCACGSYITQSHTYIGNTCTGCNYTKPAVCNHSYFWHNSSQHKCLNCGVLESHRYFGVISECIICIRQAVVGPHAIILPEDEAEAEEIVYFG